MSFLNGLCGEDVTYQTHWLTKKVSSQKLLSYVNFERMVHFNSKRVWKLTQHIEQWKIHMEVVYYYFHIKKNLNRFHFLKKYVYLKYCNRKHTVTPNRYFLRNGPWSRPSPGLYKKIWGQLLNIFNMEKFMIVISSGSINFYPKIYRLWIKFGIFQIFSLAYCSSPSKKELFRSFCLLCIVPVLRSF